MTLRLVTRYPNPDVMPAIARTRCAYDTPIRRRTASCE